MERKENKRLEEKERKEANVGASGICCRITRSGFNHIQAANAKSDQKRKVLNPSLLMISFAVLFSFVCFLF